MGTTEPRAARRPNRRGVLARERLLATALEQLATGRPEAASVNLIAKQAGLSWGSVQNLFGDSDGFWAAVVELIVDAGSELWSAPQSDTVEGRVAEVAALYRGVLASPQAIAVETVRAALPRHVDDVRASHPRTAAALERLDDLWSAAFVHFFDGLDVDEDRARDVATVLGAALRGLRDDEVRGSATDVARAGDALVAALTAHLAA